MHHPAFPLAAAIDQWAGKPVTPANCHTTLMTRPASGDKEKAGMNARLYCKHCSVFEGGRHEED